MSAATGLAKHDARKSALSAQIKECIKAKKREHDNDPHTVTLDKIVLKMDKCRVVLGTIKVVFLQHSTDGKSISREGLKKVMQYLHSDLSAEDVLQLFEFIDLDASNSIDFKEFLVSLSVCMVLGKLTAAGMADSTATDSSATSTTSNPSISGPSEQVKTLSVYRKECIEMLGLIIMAYLIFDPMGSGSIKRTEVEQILEEHTSRSVRGSAKSGGAHFFISAATWEKMDWNHDGKMNQKSIFFCRVHVFIYPSICFHALFFFRLGYMQCTTQNCAHMKYHRSFNSLTHR